MTAIAALLGVIPGWLYALALAAVLALAGVDAVRLADSRAALVAERSLHQHDLAVMASEAANASEAARTEEQRRAAADQEIARHADLAQDTIRTAAVRADAAGDGLRVRAASVVARCGPGPGDTAAAVSGAAASSPGDLLADVLGRLDAAGRELAAVADQRGVAGGACVAAYGALSQ